MVLMVFEMVFDLHRLQNLKILIILKTAQAEMYHQYQFVLNSRYIFNMQ